MSQSYLQIPVDFKALMKPGLKKRISISDSVSQHLDLIIASAHGDHRYDEGYGFMLWSNDFELLTTRKWKDEMGKSLATAIEKYEPRLTQVQVQIEVKQIEIEDKKMFQIRKQMLIELQAILKHTKEPFRYVTKFFISPFDLVNSSKK